MKNSVLVDLCVLVFADNAIFCIGVGSLYVWQKHVQELGDQREGAYFRRGLFFGNTVWRKIFTDGRSLLFLIFMDAHTCAHCTVMVQSSLFRGFNFSVSRSFAKPAKIGPLENFPLYSS